MISTSVLSLSLLLAGPVPAPLAQESVTPLKEHDVLLQEEVDRGEQEVGTVLRMYEVRDLGFDDWGAVEEGAVTFGPLLDLIQREVELREPHEALRLTKGTLVANLAPEKHDRVAELLAFQRESRDDVILLEAQVFEAESFRIDGEAVSATTVLGRGQTLQADGEVSVTTAPKVIALPARHARISTGREVAFIRRYEVVEHVQPGDRRVEIPVIDHVLDGLQLDTRMHWAGGDRIELRVLLEQNELVEFEVGRDEESGRALDLPVVKSRSAEAHAVLEEGEALLLMGDTGGETPVALLLQVRGVDEALEGGSGEAREDAPLRRR